MKNTKRVYFRNNVLICVVILNWIFLGTITGGIHGPLTGVATVFFYGTASYKTTNLTTMLRTVAIMALTVVLTFLLEIGNYTYPQAMSYAFMLGPMMMIDTK